MRRDQAVGRAGQGLNVRAQLIGAEGAVEARADGIGMADGVIEGLGRLAREGAAAGIGDRPRNQQRPARGASFEFAFDRKDRRLGVQRVEDGFDHQQVGTAVQKAAVASV
jgi:hypothetical protein